MGRKPTRHHNLPPRMRARIRGSKTWYYYDAGGKPRKEIPLGADYLSAVQKWAELEQEAHTTTTAVITFRDAAQAYRRDILPTKAEATRQGNLRELKVLLQFFDNPPAPLDSIEPRHIQLFLDWRVQWTKQKNKAAGKTSAGDGKVRANREKALFSHIWNYARARGYTSAPNPCAGISGYKEQPREIYVDDTAYMAVYNVSDSALQDAMDLAWLTGQRPADVLKMSETDIKDAALWVKQNKTGAKLRISIEGKLADLIHRIMARKRQYNVRSLKLLIDLDGTPLTYSTFRSKFDQARAVSGQTWQFRDLRAKAGTEKDNTEGESAAQALLAHSNAQMTRTYIRHRTSKLVKPTR